MIIQTAKIGDYVNTTIIFDSLNTADIIIDKINLPFAKNEEKLNNIYLINDFKKNKLKAVLTIFFNNYDNVYVLMPNTFNTFLASVSLAKNKHLLETYSTKWYVKLLSFNFTKVIHTKENLTIDNYVKLINPTNSYKNFKKTLPVIQNKKHFDTNFKVGISLSAGNGMKTIGIDTWEKIFAILSKFELSIYFFGLENEEVYLQKILPILKNYNLNFYSLLGQSKLEELPFEISMMNLYISSDTGNSYIADTFDIPLINFAGPCYMKEQRPVGNNVLIIESNASCVPFSFIFDAPYKTQCDNLYTLTPQQENIIENFISETVDKFFQSR